MNPTGRDGMIDHGEWRPVRVYGCGVQPHMGREWNCDPAWDVVALYQLPDEELVSPDGTTRRSKASRNATRRTSAALTLAFA